MPMMLSQLYRALQQAGVPEDAARLAAEEVASFDSRIAATETKLSVLVWMVGANITINALTLGFVAQIIFRLGGNA